MLTRPQTQVPEYSEGAKDYASYILSLARNNEPVFICHFYNYYFGALQLYMFRSPVTRLHACR